MFLSPISQICKDVWCVCEAKFGCQIEMDSDLQWTLKWSLQDSIMPGASSANKRITEVQNFKIHQFIDSEYEMLFISGFEDHKANGNDPQTSKLIGRL